MTMPYPPVPGWQPAPQPLARNGFGTTALVLGIVGAVFAVIPIIGVIAWPLVILGLIFGVLGIVRAQRGQATNRGSAIAGTVLSAAGLLICLLWTAAFSSATQEFQRGYEQGTSGATGAAPTYTAPTYSSPAAAADASVDPVAPGTFGEGTQVVGVDVEPGTYRSTGAKKGLFEFCSWRTLAGPSDNSATLDFGTANADEPMVVEIGPEVGAFKSSNCEPWQPVG